MSRSEPYRMISLARADSRRHGVSSEKPCASAVASSTRFQYSSLAEANGETAPSLMERSGSGTTSSGSTSSLVPSPSQVVQAPYGELNEKFRGWSSSNDRPSNVQASFSENVTSSSLPSVCTASAASPSDSSSAVSTESATRRRMSGRATSRSTTTSMSCLKYRSSRIGSDRSRTSPSM